MKLTFENQFERYKGVFGNITELYKKRKDVQKFLELFLSLFAVIIFSLFAIRPTVSTIISLTKEIKSKEETILIMDEKIENLKTAQSNYYQYKDAIDILVEALPSEPQPEDIIPQMEQAALTNKVYTNGISLGQTIIKGDTSVAPVGNGLPAKTKGVSITYTGEGDYLNLAGLIRAVDNFRRPIKFDSASITKKKTKEGEVSSTLMINFSGNVVFYSSQTVEEPQSDTISEEKNE